MCVLCIIREQLNFISAVSYACLLVPHILIIPSYLTISEPEPIPEIPPPKGNPPPSHQLLVSKQNMNWRGSNHCLLNRSQC
jgi:hypothetical protein